SVSRLTSLHSPQVHLAKVKEYLLPWLEQISKQQVVRSVPFSRSFHSSLLVPTSFMSPSSSTSMLLILPPSSSSTTASSRTRCTSPSRPTSGSIVCHSRAATCTRSTASS